MGLGNAAVGAGATLLSKFLSLKTWTLVNLDTNEVLQGQFPPDDNSADFGANWASITTLNRQNPILQFLNGAGDTCSINARFYRRDLLDDAPPEKVQTLIEWSRIDSKYRRPPILAFILGAGDLAFDQCVLEKVSNVHYSTPDFFGGVREVKFTLNFRRFTKFSLEETGVTDTRYARARDRDYYEFLAQEEYGDALIGDVIRKLHPQQLLLDVGDVVKLPSIEGVRTKRVQPKSAILASAYGRKDTAQRRLRIQRFNKRSASAVSYLFDQSGARSTWTPLSLSALAFWLPSGGVTLGSPPVSKWTGLKSLVTPGTFEVTEVDPVRRPTWNELERQIEFKLTT